jgi:hypothetical protein
MYPVTNGNPSTEIRVVAGHSSSRNYTACYNVKARPPKLASNTRPRGLRHCDSLYIGLIHPKRGNEKQLIYLLWK